MEDCGFSVLKLYFVSICTTYTFPPFILVFEVKLKNLCKDMLQQLDFLLLFESYYDSMTAGAC